MQARSPGGRHPAVPGGDGAGIRCCIWVNRRGTRDRATTRSDGGGEQLGSRPSARGRRSAARAPRRRSVVPSGRRPGRPVGTHLPGGRPCHLGGSPFAGEGHPGGPPSRCQSAMGSVVAAGSGVARCDNRATGAVAPHPPTTAPVASSMRADSAERVPVRRRRDRTGTQRDCGSVLIPHEVGVMKSIGGSRTRSTGEARCRRDDSTSGRPWRTGRDVVRLVGPPVVALGLLISILHAPHGLAAALPSATTVGNMQQSSHSSSGSTP